MILKLQLNTRRECLEIPSLGIIRVAVFVEVGVRAVVAEGVFFDVWIVFEFVLKLSQNMSTDPLN